MTLLNLLHGLLWSSWQYTKNGAILAFFWTSESNSARISSLILPTTRQPSYIIKTDKSKARFPANVNATQRNVTQCKLLRNLLNTALKNPQRKDRTTAQHKHFRCCQEKSVMQSSVRLAVVLAANGKTELVSICLRMLAERHNGPCVELLSFLGSNGKCVYFALRYVISRLCTMLRCDTLRCAVLPIAGNRA